MNGEHPKSEVVSSKTESNRDKALRREVVKVSDGRLSEMQVQAISWEGVGECEYHWHWAAIVNELIARRAVETTSVRTPCDDCKADRDQLRAALKVAQQALIEFSHAQESGPSWYTRGTDGMYRQIRLWLQRGLEAVREALGPYDDNGRYLKEMSPEEPSADLCPKCEQPISCHMSNRAGTIVNKCPTVIEVNEDGSPLKASDDLNCYICGKLWRSQHTDQERADCSAAL